MQPQEVETKIQKWLNKGVGQSAIRQSGTFHSISLVSLFLNCTVFWYINLGINFISSGKCSSLLCFPVCSDPSDPLTVSLVTFTHQIRCLRVSGHWWCCAFLPAPAVGCRPLLAAPARCVCWAGQGAVGALCSFAMALLALHSSCTWLRLDYFLISQQLNKSCWVE